MERDEARPIQSLVPVHRGQAWKGNILDSLDPIRLSKEGFPSTAQASPGPWSHQGILLGQLLTHSLDRQVSTGAHAQPFWDPTVQNLSPWMALLMVTLHIWLLHHDQDAQQGSRRPGDTADFRECTQESLLGPHTTCQCPSDPAGSPGPWRPHCSTRVDDAGAQTA